MRIVATLLALVALSSPVIAQDQRTGTLIPKGDQGSMVEEAGRIRPSERAATGNAAAIRRAANEAHETMRRYAACLVFGTDNSRQRQALVDFLSVSPDSALGQARAQRVSKPDCLNAVGTGADSVLLGYDAQLLRGGLFRALYLDLERPTHAAPVTRAQIAAAWMPEVRGSFAATVRFADCVVAANPSGANALVKARIGSAEQDAAVQAVAGVMGGCLQHGLTLQMSRIVLEGVIAEALYRRATAPADAVTAPSTASAAATGQK